MSRHLLLEISALKSDNQWNIVLEAFCTLWMISMPRVVRKWNFHFIVAPVAISISNLPWTPNKYAFAEMQRDEQYCLGNGEFLRRPSDLP